MKTLRDLSLRGKLFVGMAVTSFVAMALTLTAFSLQELKDTRERFSERMHALSNVVFLNGGTAILSDSGAALAIESFRSDPSVSQVMISDSAGRRVAGFGLVDSLPDFFLTDVPAEAATFFKGDRLCVYHPLLKDGVRVGAIIVVADSEYGGRLVRFVLEGVGVSLLALLFVVCPLAFILGKMIGAPARQLSGLAKTISSNRDYSPRAALTQSGEFGDLEHAFNEMLDTIEEQQTEIRAARAEELKKGAGFWDVVFGRFPAQIAIYDTELRYVYVNPASVSDPVKRRGIIGTTSFEYWKSHPANREAGRKRYEAARRCLESGAITSVEESLVTRTGETRYYIRMFNPVVSPDGEVSVIIGYGLDVTDRTHAEQLLQEKEERERQTARLESVGRLAGGIAHDFNNLLTVIAGYASVLRDEFDADDTARDALENIASASKRATALTGQLLAYGRKQVLQPRVLDVGKALADSERWLRETLGEETKLTKNFTHTASVYADPDQLRQVIANIALNARDAMPEGGAFEIRTRDVKLTSGSDDVLIGVVDPGRYVRLSFCDSGTGMDDDTLRRAPEPFFTTKEVGSGAGLGLATVYGIVLQSGGAINLKSEPGVGTEVDVLLPVAEENAPPGKPTARGSAPARGGLVLLVEDETMVRDFTRTLLEKWGYDVLEASTPARAIELVRSAGGPIDLVLTDVIMPGMTGVELAEELRLSQRGFRVIYMSGYAEPIIEGGANRSGGTFIQKPFRPAELKAVIEETLEGRANL